MHMLMHMLMLMLMHMLVHMLVHMHMPMLALVHMQGLRRAVHMAPDARRRAMVLHGGGAAGKLQWWSPLADRQLLALDVVRPHAPARAHMHMHMHT